LRRRAFLACLTAATMLVVCGLLIVVAVLAPAPVTAMPVLLLFCLAGPMVAAHELSTAIPVLRGERALARLRRGLARLPETAHPLEH
jgi:hypothetical protein